MKTTFSEHQMAFTKRAHRAAQQQFYPLMFPDLPITFEDTVATTKDLEYAIDCKVAVTVPDLRAPLTFSVQERWRRPDGMRFGDVTITEWNLPSNQPSELHKLGAQLFVYGFYDELSEQVVLAVAVDVVTVLYRLALRRLKWTRESRVDQTFLGFSYRDLETIGAVVFRVDNRQPVVTADDVDWPAAAPPGSGLPPEWRVS